VAVIRVYLPDQALRHRMPTSAGMLNMHQLSPDTARYMTGTVSGSQLDWVTWLKRVAAISAKISRPAATQYVRMDCLKRKGDLTLLLPALQPFKSVLGLCHRKFHIENRAKAPGKDQVHDLLEVSPGSHA